MGEGKYWQKNADSHAKDIVKTLRLYFRGHMPFVSVEQAFKKVVGDSALLTQQDIGLDMDKVKELIQKLKISVPENFEKVFPNTKFKDK